MIQKSVCRKPRLRISSQYLLESLNALYFALFNGTPELAVQAIDAVHQRALYEFYADVILVCFINFCFLTGLAKPSSNCLLFAHFLMPLNYVLLFYRWQTVLAKPCSKVTSKKMRNWWQPSGYVLENSIIIKEMK